MVPLFASLPTAFTSRLQRGQSARLSSHKSKHERWKMCPHFPSCRTVSPTFKSPKQIGHSHISPNSLSVATKCGSSWISAAERPPFKAPVRAVYPGNELTWPHRPRMSESSIARKLNSTFRRRYSNSQAIEPIPTCTTIQAYVSTCHVTTKQTSMPMGKHCAECLLLSTSQYVPRPVQTVKRGSMSNHVNDTMRRGSAPLWRKFRRKSPDSVVA
mmetsp:Transcript_80171/g.141858  ORF Transcript_80171/g.141858 Transcript_80171/m.141858 type:complete len:214 (-) Transcript_80171:258-899(-)